MFYMFCNVVMVRHDNALSSRDSLTLRGTFGPVVGGRDTS